MQANPEKVNSRRAGPYFPHAAGRRGVGEHTVWRQRHGARVRPESSAARSGSPAASVSLPSPPCGQGSSTSRRHVWQASSASAGSRFTGRRSLCLFVQVDWMSVVRAPHGGCFGQRRSRLRPPAQMRSSGECRATRWSIKERRAHPARSPAGPNLPSPQ